MIDYDEIGNALRSACDRVLGQGIDVHEVAFVKEATAPPPPHVPAPPAPNCPADPGTFTRELVKSKSGRSLAALPAEIKKGLSPVAKDTFFGPASATKETSAKLLAELTAVARRVPGATPELVHGIVQASEDEKVTRVFTTDLWPSVWNEWNAKPVVREDTNLDDDRPPELLGIDEETPLIIIHKDSYYAKKADEGYDVVGVTAASLVPRIQEINRAKEFGVDYQDEKGNWKKRSQTWILTHATTGNVDQVTYEVGAESRVEHLGTPRAALRHGVAPVDLNLPPLSPDEIREQEEIDVAIVGPERVELYRDYFAVLGREEWPLQFGHLDGDTGTGKGFSLGGARNLFGGSSGQDTLTTPFCESLLHYSLILEEEGLNCDERNLPPLVSRVRDFVTNEMNQITRKGRPTVQLKRHLRIIVSENGDRSLRMVLGDDNAASQRASMVRVISFKTLPSAKKFFDDKGGRAWSSKPGAEQIDGDPHNGGMKRARYYAWLARERVLVNVDPGGRFAIRDPRETITSAEGTDIRMIQPRALAILEILAGSKPCKADQSDLLVAHDGRLYVSAGDLTAKLRARRNSIACTNAQVSNDLKMFAPADPEVNKVTRRDWTAARRRLHCIDALKVVEAAEEQKIDVTEAIVELAEIRTTR